MYALDNDGALLVHEKPNKKSKFNWAREPLTLNTEITDNITFGQNLRAFFTEQIGQRFKFTIELWSGVKPMQGILSYSGDQMVRTRSSSIICRISD